MDESFKHYYSKPASTQHTNKGAENAFIRTGELSAQYDSYTLSVRCTVATIRLTRTKFFPTEHYICCFWAERTVLVERLLNIFSNWTILRDPNFNSRCFEYNTNLSFQFNKSLFIHTKFTWSDPNKTNFVCVSPISRKVLKTSRKY